MALCLLFIIRTPTLAKLAIHPDNPHYFIETASGKPVVLIGRLHNTPSFQDKKTNMADIDAGLRETVNIWKANHGRHWTIKSWRMDDPDRHWPWKRVSGHGKTNAGLEKFDLSQWDEWYWSRFRQYLELAEKHGVYIQIQLWDRSGISKAKKRWNFHPFNPDNNINHIPDLPNGNKDGRLDNAFYNLSNSKLIYFQQLYVDKLVKETSRFSSAIYEICNEYCDINYNSGPAKWEQHWMDFVKLRCNNIVAANSIAKNTKPKGTPDYYWTYKNLDMVNWHTICPNQAFDRFADHYYKNRAMCHGEQAFAWNENLNCSSTPSCKEIRMLGWGNFLGGGHFTWDQVNEPAGCNPNDTTKAIGMFLEETEFDFVHAAPNSDVVSNGWCMAEIGNEYLIYLPNGGSVSVYLAGITQVEFRWFNPYRRNFSEAITKNTVNWVNFTSPFPGDVVLYIKNNGNTGNPRPENRSELRFSSKIVD